MATMTYHHIAVQWFWSESRGLLSIMVFIRHFDCRKLCMYSDGYQEAGRIIEFTVLTLCIYTLLIVGYDRS